MRKPLASLTNSAQWEVKFLRRNKATQGDFDGRVEYYENSAARMELDYARDLAAWLDGTNTRPDLADPRDPSVAAARADFVAVTRQTAADINLASPKFK